MIALDANLRPTIPNPALARVQERLCLLNRQLRAFFGSLLIACSLKQKMTTVGFEADELRALTSFRQVSLNNIGCRRALLQEHANDRRSDPENTLKLHLTGPLLTATQFASHISRGLDGVRIN